MGALALLITAILATLVLYFWARKEQLEKLLLEEREENERMLSVAEDLQARLKASAAAAKGGGKPLPGLDVLERLCEQYYVFEGTENLQPRILSEVKNVIDGLRSDPKMQGALEASLDASTGGAMSALRAAFPKWKEEDFLLCIFSASGFSSTTISTLLEKDKPYVYNRLYRIKERIKASEDFPEKDKILSLLGR